MAREESRERKKGIFLVCWRNQNIVGLFLKISVRDSRNTKPGSEAGRCAFWPSVGSLGRSSWVDAADSDARRCLVPGLEGPRLEVGRSKLGYSLMWSFLAWPPRVGGVDGDFGGTSVPMLFLLCSPCWRQLLQQRLWCPTALLSDAVQEREHPAGVCVNDELKNCIKWWLALKLGAPVLPKHRLLSDTRGRRIVGG